LENIEIRNYFAKKKIETFLSEEKFAFVNINIISKTRLMII
jgi:hypothetical protein